MTLSRAESRHGTKSALFTPELGVAKAWRLAMLGDDHGAVAAARDAARAAERSGSFVVPVGEAWQRALVAAPKVATDFAKARVEQGMGLIEATLEGARLRLRPILMTSLAFGFGVLPLMLATGAGAGAQKAIGTGVFGGVVTATFLVTLFAPLFYVLIEKTFGKRSEDKAAKTGGADLSEEDK